MARKKRVSFGERLEHVVSDVADAASVAATGSQLGILELAAEEELGMPAKPARKRKAKTTKRKPKAAARKSAGKKKKIAVRKPGKGKKKKPAARRR